MKCFVEQFHNKNQFVIEYNNPDGKDSDIDGNTLLVFQSYRSVIAIYNPITKKLFVNWNKWDYSKTTMKHLKMFINEYTCYRYDNKYQFSSFLRIESKMVVLFEE